MRGWGRGRERDAAASLCSAGLRAQRSSGRQAGSTLEMRWDEMRWQTVVVVEPCWYLCWMALLGSNENHVSAGLRSIRGLPCDPPVLFSAPRMLTSCHCLLSNPQFCHPVSLVLKKSGERRNGFRVLHCLPLLIAYHSSDPGGSSWAWPWPWL